MTLPGRMSRIAERIIVPKDSVKFKWVESNGML